MEMQRFAPTGVLPDMGLRRISSSLMLAVLLPLVALQAREEQLPLTDSRHVAITVPDGFNYKAGANAKGELGIVITDAKEQMSLTVTFEPDLENVFRQQRARTEKMHEEFRDYVEGSVEKAMQFAELKPKVGAGTYCVFTDAKLVGQPASGYPKGEYLNLTVGVKAWPGIVATFTLFSNGTDTKAYRTLMRVLQESVHEKPAPLL